MNLNDTGVHKKRNKKENIRTWERETGTNKANICPWGDPWKSESNPCNQGGDWWSNTVYYRSRSRIFQDENRESYKNCRQLPKDKTITEHELANTEDIKRKKIGKARNTKKSKEE